MSLQWEPEWEEIIVESHGVRLKVLRDKLTGLYACPVCGLGSNASYFFSIEDLVQHIIAHAEGAMKGRIKVKIVGHETQEEPQLEE